jgi:hypothetical protein
VPVMKATAATCAVIRLASMELWPDHDHHRWQEAIMFSLLTCLNPGDEVIVPEPFYTNYNGFACAAGCKRSAHHFTYWNRLCLPPSEDFEKVIATRTIMICINNPTGYLYSKKRCINWKIFAWSMIFTSSVMKLTVNFVMMASM